MTRDDIAGEASERHLSRRQQREPLISFATLSTIGITTTINLVLLAFSYGALVQKVDAVADALQLIQQRDITPGAERRISVLEVQVAQQRVDSTDWKREMRDTLARIEAKVDAHMAKEQK